MSLKIRDAVSQEADLLTDLALRSKAHWGYSKQFLESCRDELTVHPALVEHDDYRYVVAEEKESIVGYYALKADTPDIFELEAIFVDPRHIRTGVGKKLLEHAIRRLSRLGAKRLVIQGDPNAAGFYEAAGARRVGERESASIPGRFLPLFEIDV